MNTEFSPISFSTAFSLLLHAAFAVAIVQTQDVIQATGKGLEIELVNSSYISQQVETEQAANRAATLPQQNRHDEQSVRNLQSAPTEKSIEAKRESANKQLAETSASAPGSIEDDSGEKTVSRSTNAAMNNSSIIELLHSKISEHKQYPYICLLYTF